MEPFFFFFFLGFMPCAFYTSWAMNPSGKNLVCHLTLSLPAVTKTEFLLTISIQSQVDK